MPGSASRLEAPGCQPRAMFGIIYLGAKYGKRHNAAIWKMFVAVRTEYEPRWETDNNLVVGTLCTAKP